MGPAPATNIGNGEFLLTLNPHHTLAPFALAIAPDYLLAPPRLVSVSQSGSLTDPNVSAVEFFNTWAASFGVGMRAGAWDRHPGLTGAGEGKTRGSQFNFRLVLQRSGNRSRHRQHPHLCEGRRHRVQRAVGGRGAEGFARLATRARDRIRGEEDARPHAGIDRRYPAAQRRRDRRLRDHREHAPLLYPEDSYGQDHRASAPAY